MLMGGHIPKTEDGPEMWVNPSRMKYILLGVNHKLHLRSREKVQKNYFLRRILIKLVSASQ